MGNEILTPIIIGVAVVAAVVILILLFKKLIKSVLALALIAIIIVGCYAGLRAIDNSTNLRHKLDSVDTAFSLLQQTPAYQSVKNIQCNYLGTDIGINVIYTVDAEATDAMTQLLLSDTRAVLLESSRYNEICLFYADENTPSAPPKKLMVGIKYKGLDIQYYNADLTVEEPQGLPDSAYSEFNLVIDTGK